MKHWVCGYWYRDKVAGDEGELVEWPNACWTPSLAVHDSKVFMVAASTWYPHPIIFAEYDLGRNHWEQIYFENQGVRKEDLDVVIFAPYSGEAQFVAGFKGAWLWKYDIGGPYGNGTPTDFGMGLWLIQGTTVTYQEFLDARTETTLDTAGKMALNAAGVVVVMYTVDASGGLVVKLSDDFGASFNTVQTVANNAARKDYGVVIESNGDIVIAYQAAANTVSFQRSTDNGATWSTVVTRTLGTTITRLTFKDDGTYLWCCVKGTTTRLHRLVKSTFVNTLIKEWTTAATFVEPYSNTKIVKTYTEDTREEFFFYNGTAWVDSTGDGFTVLSRLLFAEHRGSLAGEGEWYVYSNYNLYYEPQNAFALVVSYGGIHWDYLATPLTWRDSYYDDEVRLGDLVVYPVWPFTGQVNKPKISWNWSKI